MIVDPTYVSQQTAESFPRPLFLLHHPRKFRQYADSQALEFDIMILMPLLQIAAQQLTTLLDPDHYGPSSHHPAVPMQGYDKGLIHTDSLKETDMGCVSMGALQLTSCRPPAPVTEPRGHRAWSKPSQK